MDHGWQKAEELVMQMENFVDEDVNPSRPAVPVADVNENIEMTSGGGEGEHPRAIGC